MTPRKKPVLARNGKRDNLSDACQLAKTVPTVRYSSKSRISTQTTASGHSGPGAWLKPSKA